MDCFEERRQVLLQELAALSGEGALYGFLMRQGKQLPALCGGMENGSLPPAGMPVPGMAAAGACRRSGAD